MDHRKFTVEEIVKNNESDNNNLWVIIDGNVYDVTNFKHPGGKEVFDISFGKDRLDEFIGHSPEAYEKLKKLQIGIVID